MKRTSPSPSPLTSRARSSSSAGSSKIPTVHSIITNNSNGGGKRPVIRSLNLAMDEPHPSSPPVLPDVSPKFIPVHETILQIRRELLNAPAEVTKGIQIDRLCRALHRMWQQIVGHDDIKKSVIQQIRYFVSIRARGKSNKNMLHTLLYGPPGTGKTMIARHLARIWSCLGVLITAKQQQQDPHPPSNPKPKSATAASIREVRDRLQAIFLESQLENTILQQNNIKLLEMLSQIRTMSIRNVGMLTRAISKIINTSRDTDLIDILTKVRHDVEDVRSMITNNAIQSYSSSTSTTSLSSSPTHIRPASATSSAKAKSSGGGSATTTTTAVVNWWECEDEEQEEKEMQDLVVEATRAKCVAGYVGQTAILMTKLLESAIGKVLFIDEFYSFLNGERDSFGMEALTVLNQFMSEHGDELIVIMTGYRNKLDALFAEQPGLYSRISWKFEMASYTAMELFDIFRTHAEKAGYVIDDVPKFQAFFTKQYNSFGAFGRDCERLLFYAKVNQAQRVPLNVIDNHLTISDLEEAYRVFIGNLVQSRSTENLSYYL